jgi:dienelactone hydrolase
MKPLALVVLLAVTSSAIAAESSTLVKIPADGSNPKVPEPFRMPEQSFTVTQKLRYELPASGVEVHQIQFPSFVKSSHASNDTVYGECFRPKKPGKKPAVIVLDILDGAGLVSRGEAVWLASQDVVAVTLVMPYYGPRRPTGEKLRMLSTDIKQSMDNVKQAIWDSRRAIAWLAEQPDVDPERIGVVGTSLGSFLGGVTAAAEPRVKSACLLLGGGDLVEVYYDHPQAALVLQALRLIGITKDTLKKQISWADPLTFAPQLKDKRLLLIGASRDDVVPPIAMKRLWEATGQPKIVWLDATHVGAAAYAFKAMNSVIAHIKE